MCRGVHEVGCLQNVCAGVFVRSTLYEMCVKGCSGGRLQNVCAGVFMRSAVYKMCVQRCT